MFDQSLTDALIDAVRAAARAEIMPRFRRLAPGDISSKSGPTDLVTEADVAMETRLRAEFERILPGVAFVGEESIADDPGMLDVLTRREEAIILDPIDGTWNFAHGLAGFGTLLALADAEGTAFGLLYDPILDDWVWSARGRGTHHSEGARLTTSTRREIGALSGVFSLADATEAGLSALAPVLPRFRRITDLRASLWDYRMLCEGHLDFAVNRMLNPWDHAAGALALTEAGGVARLADGTDYAPHLRKGRLIAASGPGTWQIVRDAFAPVLDQ